MPLSHKILKEVFDFIDIDQNGWIDMNEFKLFSKGLKKIGDGHREKKESANMSDLIKMYKSANNKMHLSKLIKFV